MSGVKRLLSLRCGFLLVALCFACGGVRAVELPIDVYFNGLDTGMWSTYTANGGTVPYVSGGRIYFEAASGVYGSRSELIYKINDGLLNPGLYPLQITFSDLSLTTDQSGAAGENDFIAFIGLGDYNDPSKYSWDYNLFSLKGTAAFRIGLLNGGCRLQVADWGKAADGASTTSYTLDGVPSNIVWIVDGENREWSIELQGASADGIGSLITGTYVHYDPVTTYPSGTYSRVVLGALGSAAPVGNTYVSLDTLTMEKYVPPPTTPVAYYNVWAQEKGLTASNGVYSMTGDPDEDLYDNLTEYSLGGDPLNGSEQGNIPQFTMIKENGTNWCEFVHAERADKAVRGLSYAVQSVSDLLGGGWTSSNVLLVGTGVMDSDFNVVTSRVPADVLDIQFLQLQVALQE